MLQLIGTWIPIANDIGFIRLMDGQRKVRCINVLMWLRMRLIVMIVMVVRSDEVIGTEIFGDLVDEQLLNGVAIPMQ